MVNLLGGCEHIHSQYFSTLYVTLVMYSHLESICRRMHAHTSVPVMQDENVPGTTDSMLGHWEAASACLRPGSWKICLMDKNGVVRADRWVKVR